MSKKFSTFSEFYPFYLNEHSNLTCDSTSSGNSSLPTLTQNYRASANNQFVKEH